MGRGRLIMSKGYSLKLYKLNQSADDSLLGVRLGRLCMSIDMPVSEAASRLGVSRQTVYNWFSGTTTPLNRYYGLVLAFMESLPHAG
jgi:transcriptional regulator with XRE-family HTH domain